ncbi:uncharacterized protein LOC124692977 [Lolium rigidum]|uniref:uncharacterized protein LOC124692977 n=1 Tax=Lolium rigidum TaxID=89674 RepID=UPI001F5C132E|nr:uncharacterized protein LOC124692977 [Lolium rigidum]
MDTEIVLPAHLIGGHPSNELLVTKFELIRLLILDMMEVTSDPVYHRRIHQKGATGKISVVRGATGAPSQQVSKLLKDCKTITDEIITSGAEAMATPQPIDAWVKEQARKGTLSYPQI